MIRAGTANKMATPGCYPDFLAKERAGLLRDIAACRDPEQAASLRQLLAEVDRELENGKTETKDAEREF